MSSYLTSLHLHLMIHVFAFLIGLHEILSQEPNDSHLAILTCPFMLASLVSIPGAFLSCFAHLLLYLLNAVHIHRKPIMIVKNYILPLGDSVKKYPYKNAQM